MAYDYDFGRTTELNNYYTYIMIIMYIVIKICLQTTITPNIVILYKYVYKSINV